MLYVIKGRGVGEMMKLLSPGIVTVVISRLAVTPRTTTEERALGVGRCVLSMVIHTAVSAVRGRLGSPLTTMERVTLLDVVSTTTVPILYIVSCNIYYSVDL